MRLYCSGQVARLNKSMFSCICLWSDLHMSRHGPYCSYPNLDFQEWVTFGGCQAIQSLRVPTFAVDRVSPAQIPPYVAQPGFQKQSFLVAYWPFLSCAFPWALGCFILQLRVGDDRYTFWCSR